MTTETKADTKRITIDVARRQAAAEGFSLVASDRFHELKNIVNRLNHKAEQWGHEGIKLETKPPFMVFFDAIPPHPVQDVNNSGQIYTKFIIPGKAARFIEHTPVQMSGQRPILNGWRVAGSVEHIDNKGSQITRVPGIGTSIPQKYWDLALGKQYPLCEHCGMDRRRTQAFILNKDDGDEWKQVGSTCVEDFTGEKDVARILGWATSAASIDLDSYGYDGSGGNYRVVENWAATDFLANVAAASRAFGWVSRKKANEDGGVATVDKVLERLQKMINKDDIEKMKANGTWYDVRPEDADTAKKAHADVLDNLTQKKQNGYLDDFEQNLFIALHNDFVTAKSAPVLASLFAVAERIESRAAVKEAREAKLNELKERSEWVGEIGTRYDLELFYEEGRAMPASQWGQSYLYKFTDKDGNLFSWFSQKDLAWLSLDNRELNRMYDRDPKAVPFLHKGTTYKARATVKEHRVFRAKETALTRLEFDPKGWTLGAARKGGKKVEPLPAPGAKRQAALAEVVPPAPIEYKAEVKEGMN